MQTQNPQIQAPEKKERIPVWLYPSTLETIDRAMQMANCKSRSEFLENAARFYAGYISGEAATSYLPVALVDALKATIQNSENRTARLLFKLAVEIGVMMNVLTLGMDVSRGELEQLRAQSVRDVKRTNGSVFFKDAMELQQNDGAEW